MIPLKDNIPHKKLPVISSIIIGINVLIFLYQMMLPYNDFKNFIYIYGFIPKRFLNSFDFYEKFFPILSSMFLHANLPHLFGNMLFMWVFADNVEDKLGHFKFFIFYLLCGIFAVVAHLFFNPYSTLPAIGASGAVSGVLGAYFLFFPYAKVLTLIPTLFFYRILEIPAFVFLGIWFLYQFFFGLISISGNSFMLPVAFWAHIGGFLAGLILANLYLNLKED